MNRNLFIIGLGVALVLMAILLKEFVRDVIIIPLFRLIRFVDDLPQDILWFFSIGVMVFFAYKSLIHWRLPRFKDRTRKIERTGQIDAVAGLIKRSQKGGYYREHLAQYLCDLILETLAYRERVTTDIIKERLNSGTMDVPHDILSYLKAGTHEVHFARKRKGILLQTDTYGSIPDLDPERIVTFLENHLEHRSEVAGDKKA